MVLVGKPKGKDQLDDVKIDGNSILGSTLVLGIKMGRSWIHLFMDGDKWRAVIITAMNTARHFLTI